MAEKKAVVVSMFLLNENESDDSDADLSDIVLPLLTNLNGERTHHTRIPEYFETCVPRYSDGMFKTHFRIGREGVEELCQLLHEHPLLNQNNRGGRQMVDLGKQICIFLWFSASKELYRRQIRCD